MNNAKKLTEAHQSCIEIIEAISYFETMIKHSKRSLNGPAATFNELRARYNHNIEIYQMCIDRLKLRYNKQIDKINNQLK